MAIAGVAYQLGGLEGLGAVISESVDGGESDDSSESEEVDAADLSTDVESDRPKIPEDLLNDSETTNRNQKQGTQLGDRPGGQEGARKTSTH